jgi:hypothetical protein
LVISVADEICKVRPVLQLVNAGLLTSLDFFSRWTLAEKMRECQFNMSAAVSDALIPDGFHLNDQTAL